MMAVNIWDPFLSIPMYSIRVDTRHSLCDQQCIGFVTRFVTISHFIGPDNGSYIDTVKKDRNQILPGKHTEGACKLTQEFDNPIISFRLSPCFQAECSAHLAFIVVPGLRASP
jgi:hypothetical protein